MTIFDFGTLFSEIEFRKLKNSNTVFLGLSFSQIGSRFEGRHSPSSFG